MHQKCANLVYEHAGRDLKRILHDDKFEPAPAQIRSTMCGLLAGLQAVHSTGLVHTDVKPANVLIQMSGTSWHARLGDVGGVVEAAAEDSKLWSDI